MNAKDVQHYRNVLIEKRRQLMHSDTTLERTVAEEINLGAGNSKFYAAHLVEVLEEALLRLETGGFGICLQCGKKIPKERLEAVPHTRYCVPCKPQRN